MFNNTSTSSSCSFSSDLDVLFSNEEMDNVALMGELKSILSYGSADAGDNSPEFNVTDEMDFLDSWNEEDDLEKFVSSLDSKTGLFMSLSEEWRAKNATNDMLV